MSLPKQIQELLDFKFRDDPQFTYKQYILVRTDLSFSRGKLMVHAAHNATSALLWWFQRTKKNWDDPETERIRFWFNSGRCQAKIVLKVKNEEEIKEWIIKTNKYNPNIPTAIVKDGGAYEVEPDTIVACCIGPVSPEEAEELGLSDKKKLPLFR